MATLDPTIDAPDDGPDPVCSGCNNPIEEGSVVSFGDNLWHVPCFRCAKCHNLVEVESNLLLRSDGSPICENCSYNCHICQKPIVDEAIMTGDESYHAECFRCKSCSSKIDDLVFAKTSQGIYCMSCHNQRVARSKRHAQARAASKVAGTFSNSGPNLTVSTSSPGRSSPASISPNFNNFNPSKAMNHETKSVLSPTPSNHSSPLPSPGANSMPPQHTKYFEPPPRPDLRGKGPSPDSTSEAFKAQSRSSPDTLRSKFSSPKEQVPSNTNTSAPIQRWVANDINYRTKSHGLGGSLDLHTPPEFDKRPPYDSSTLAPRPAVDRSTSYDSSNKISNNADIPRSDGNDQRGGLKNGAGRNGRFQLDVLSPAITLHTDVAKSTPSSQRRPSPTTSGFQKPSDNTQSDINPLGTPPLSLEFDNDDLLRIIGLEADGMPLPEDARMVIPISTAVQNTEKSHARSDSEIMPSVPDIKASDEAATVGELRGELTKTRKKLLEVESTIEKVRRVSQQAYQGFSTARSEYDREVALRRETEREVMQLQSTLSKQSADMNNLRRQLARQDEDVRRLRQTNSSLAEAESRLRELHSQEQIALAGLQQLAKSKQPNSGDNLDPSGADFATSVQRHLSTSLDTVKEAYGKDIAKLLSERDALEQEINHLRMIRKQCLEESQHLNTRNFELAEMNSELSRQVDVQKGKAGASFGFGLGLNRDKQRHLVGPDASMVLGGKYEEDPVVQKVQRNSVGTAPAPKKFKWKKSKVGTKVNAANQPGPPGQLNSSPSMNAGFGSGDGHALQLQHQFQQTSILRPVKCESCSEKMWGLAEVRCSVCGIMSHSKCSTFVTTPCMETWNETAEDYGPIAATFGVELAFQYEREGAKVPLIVRRCIEAVEVRGLDYEGIYRKSGGANQMRQIVVGFERGMDMDLTGEEFNDISAVTSVLKKYFRELPNPLLPFEQYEAFIQNVDLPPDEAKAEEFRRILGRLPVAHYNTLRTLMDHLQRVRAHEKENLMTPRNLSVVFGPTLMRDRDPMREIMDMTSKNSVIEYMIQHSRQFFGPVN